MNLIRNSKGETGSLLLPLCAASFSDDDEGGPCTNTACAGPSKMVVKTHEGEEEGEAVERGPQTLSVSLVPGVSSTSP